jgi:hypothetical protein
MSLSESQNDLLSLLRMPAANRKEVSRVAKRTLPLVRIPSAPPASLRFEAFSGEVRKLPIARARRELRALRRAVVFNPQAAMTMAEYQIGHRAPAVVGVAQTRPGQIPPPGLHTSEGD